MSAKPKLMAFLGYDESRNPNELRPLMGAALSALAERGIGMFCTYFENQPCGFPRAPHGVMEDFAAEAARCDLLLVIQAQDTGGNKALVEAAYGQMPIAVAVHTGDVLDPYVAKMADRQIAWKDVRDLRQKLFGTNFRELLGNFDRELAARLPALI